MASRKHGTIYVGVTNDIRRRAYEHRDKIIRGFTAKYDCVNLVWFRRYENITDAIADEKRFKKWRREWKVQMIEEDNPDWRDLYPDFA